MVRHVVSVGEPEAVANAMPLYQQAMENAKLGAQTQEGEHMPYVDADDGKPQS
ncbi:MULTISPECIES: hypothetical protein [Ralstonia solanacearum species complex]|uniref:hypothetical protein n=1 Tax=Ralstonia solanacearum species complex TaxID=3116862 RepID=UPI000B0902C2|nr:hypothetical protein [Ralstonia solanacearum]BEU74475.1 hypothetical protein MAFF211271_40300 [Ralstonia pseudosolanacearum]